MPRTVHTGIGGVDRWPFQFGGSEGVPSRRAVVRAGAWSVPAVAIVASAPAYASTSETAALVLDLGDSYLTQNADGTWDLYFLHASILVIEADLGVNELVLAVGFGTQALRVLDGQPAGFWSPGVGPSTASYLYKGAVPAGNSIAIQDGHWFGSATASEIGDLLLTVSAPGFEGSSDTVHVPPARRLVFNPGQTSAQTFSGSGGRTLTGLSFAGASLVVSGADIVQPDDLTITVTFVPAPGYSQAALGYDAAASPQGWSVSSPSPSPTSAVDFRYGQSVLAAAHAVTLPISDGQFVYTAQSSFQQSGWFQLAFSATGFPSATYLVHAPPAPQLRFDPGATTASPSTTGAGFALDFDGATVTVSSGVQLARDDLTMTVSFEPDGSSATRFAVHAGGPAGWTQQSASLTSQPTYRYGSFVVANFQDVTVPLGSGTWFETAQAASGYVVLTFTAPACQSTTYRVHVP